MPSQADLDEFKSEEGASSSHGLFTLWLQASLEDQVAEIFYTPLALTIPATALCYFNVIPFPWELAACISAVLLVLLAARATRNWFFILRSNVIHGRIGPAGSRFRRWQQFDVLFSVAGQSYRVPYAFNRNEVTEGEAVLLCSHIKNPRRILILERASDRHSLLK